MRVIKRRMAKRDRERKEQAKRDKASVLRPARTTTAIDLATAIELTIRMVQQDRLIDSLAHSLERANIEIERLAQAVARYEKLWMSGRERPFCTHKWHEREWREEWTELTCCPSCGSRRWNGPLRVGG